MLVRVFLPSSPRFHLWRQMQPCSNVVKPCHSWLKQQVRYAACVAARHFMLALGEERAAYYPALLPHLCFNRYDVAEGVCAYSQETWRLVLGDGGRAWVARCMPQVGARGHNAAAVPLMPAFLSVPVPCPRLRLQLP
jgi:hypothetical protein